MNALQTKKLAKYRAVQALLQTTTETSGIALLPVKLAALGAKLAYVDELCRQQAQPIRGAAALRDVRLAEMADAAVTVAGLIRCYASDHPSSELATRVHTRRSDFTRMRPVCQPIRAQGIHDAA